VIATLPHHVSASEEIEEIMLRLEHYVATCTATYGSAPEAVCIARSDGDGFTSTAVVEQLQERLMKMLMRLSESHWGVVELCAHDLRGECHIKCRELFMSRKQSIKRKKNMSGGVGAEVQKMSDRKRKLLEDSGFNFSSL
jgi:hypothetical protein